MKRPVMMSGKPEHKSVGWKVCMAVLFAAILLLFGKLYVISNYVAVRVQGPSMEDTLYGGVQVSPHVYEGGDTLYIRRTQEAERGDIVVIDVSGNAFFTDDKIIKRLIAKGGDSLYAEDGIVYLKKAGETDYVALEEDYVKPYSYNPAYKTHFSEVTLKQGEIFVMGDNREVSADSRSLTVQLRQEDIYGVLLPWCLDPSAGSRAESFFVRLFLQSWF